MNSFQHSALAERLITACGGLAEAAQNCRVGQSSLSNYQNPAKNDCMPADVIASLEEYCGEGIYSHALADASHGPAPSLDVFGDALAANCAVAKLTSDMHHLAQDGRLCAADRRKLADTLKPLMANIAALEAAISQPDSFRLVRDGDAA